ncbi:hypothetical protein [Deinococcus roseus]|uniref:Uncharacterized protein n=1 Tax=Deinococcus roseus TaxID=392414 RepID=A0ABQ2D1G1_9DEIO|nr:hypothetical protein [Deinococcus roseus]GGJ41463.1 hypothetical protein GCM10008938_29430 [Deinococcus roseus]
MTHFPTNSTQKIQQAISHFVAQHADQTLTFQLPGMQASTLQAGTVGSLTVSSLEEMAQDNLSELQESWNQTLIAVRNGELSHLVIDLPDGQATSLKIVPTNQDT